MKSFYLFALAAFTLSLGVNAQFIEDGFETYTLGDMSLQNPAVWSTWSGMPDNGTNILVVDDIVSSGVQSGYIGPRLSQADVQDVLLLLGNVSSGDYTVTFDMFVSGGSTAYLGIQGETEDAGMGYQGAYNAGSATGISGIFIAGNLFFNEDGLEPGVFRDELADETGIYPEDAWFPISFYIDLDALTYEITIDGTLVHAVPVPFNDGDSLGAINFFSPDANTNFWIDHVDYYEGSLAGIDDFSPTNFSVYPNPVQDVLNIRTVTSIDAIAIYDILGKLVLTTTPDTISSTMDVSSFNAGVYLVKVTIGGASKVVKVIKYEN
ncbi:T9SS type A sorting domain-containing protein [Ulvibacter antarcticus]|uniref:Putative secreted protein (Por secretion system target) n=1 Tax=Ulvibacter antarcticus TaxID=442714 RepID=A0A3L9Z0A3_9FLAO|nr:T9SS type A sorting domain-containing protein [Ulvibacter antarcticus]RMA66391.1 putative secreted protein (Por secretion system target) [Ulvibacter antarcticus]